MGHSTSKEDSEKRGWEVTGDTDLWNLLCKAVNLDTGEYHSTKVLHLRDGSAVLQCDSLVDTSGKDADPKLQFRRSMLVLPSPPAGIEKKTD